MTDDRQIDSDEVEAWDAKVRDPETQRRLEAFWTAEEDHEAEAFIREQSDAHDVAERIAKVMDEKPNEARKLREGAVTYRCRQGCLLAAAVPAGNGDVYVTWRSGPGARRISPEELDRWREGAVPDGSDIAAIRKVLDTVDEFTLRYGVAPSYCTESGAEAEALGRPGEKAVAKAGRLADLPPDGVVRMTCKHAAVELQVGDVRADMAYGKKTVNLPRQH